MYFVQIQMVHTPKKLLFAIMSIFFINKIN